MPSQWAEDRGPKHSSRSNRRYGDPVGEEGFSLIELLIVLIILPMVVGAVTIAIMTTLKNENTASNRITGSEDAQVVSANFTTDVQSAFGVTTATAVTSMSPCGSASTLLGLEWTNGGVSYVVTYSTVAEGSGSSLRNLLVRRLCKSGVVTSTHTVAYDLPSTNQGAVTVTCEPSPPAQSGSCTYASAWMSTAGVTGISFSTLESLSGYSFTLAATPRNTNNISCGPGCGGGPPLPRLLLLGSGANVLNLSAQNTSVTINGQVAFNSSNSSLVDMSAKNETVTVTNGGPFQVFGCGSPCNVIHTGASGDQYNGPAPTSVSTQTPVPVVTAPNTSGLAAASCTQAGSTYTCPPGLYASNAFSFLGSGSALTVNFSGPANSDQACPHCYVFQGQLAVTTQNNTLNFGPGAYVFDNGLAVSGSGATLQGSGLFFYIAGGSFNVSTQNNTISLAPMSTGIDTGILLYQVPSDPNPVSITASGNTTDTYGGAVIVPGASLTISAQSNGLNIGSLAAQSLSISAAGTGISIG